MPTRTKTASGPVIADARRLLVQEEAQKLVDMEEVVAQAIRRAENSGSFPRQLDKIAGRERATAPMSRARASSGTCSPS